MSFYHELNKRIAESFPVLKERNGRVVPSESNDITLGNDAVILDACILYADLAGSTDMVRYHSTSYSASVYKAYLYAASKIITVNNGTIAAFDGDRVMSVYVGDDKEDRAITTALEINYALRFMIQDTLESEYSKTFDELWHGIGIDASEVTVVRAGIRGANDFVWIGDAANQAAKLATIREQPYCIYITHQVWKDMSPEYLMDDGEHAWASHNDEHFSPGFVWKSWRWKSLIGK